jgi:hypothetical protein
MGIDPARLETGARTLQFVRSDPRFQIVALDAIRQHVTA